MPVTVPSMDDFNALEARVTALEEGGGTPPPSPNPGEGVLAKRISDLIESFGVNTFSSLDGGNVWGSWPADYTPESVIVGLKYILGDSGFAFRIREYHYQGRESFQRPWLQAIAAAFPDMRATICVGANGGVNDVPSMLDLASDNSCNISWVEGLNEPNTDFGSGTVPVETTLAIQKATSASARSVMGPSIVAGTPHPEGWITGYLGTSLDEVCSNMEWGNGHYYPPAAPDVPNTGYSVNEYIGGLWSAYKQAPIALTEFNPTLYAADHTNDQTRGPFYTLTTLLRCAKNGTMGVWWYAMYDYGTTYTCGLFPKTHANDPRPSALALKNLCAVCADRGTKYLFSPSNLDITVIGLNDQIDWDVYQASDGRFLIPVWYNAADADQGPVVQVELVFGAPKRTARMYNVLQSSTPVDTITGATSMVMDIAPGVYVVEVMP